MKRILGSESRGTFAGSGIDCLIYGLGQWDVTKSSEGPETHMSDYK